MSKRCDLIDSLTDELLESRTALRDATARIADLEAELAEARAERDAALKDRETCAVCAHNVDQHMPVRCSECRGRGEIITTSGTERATGLKSFPCPKCNPRAAGGGDR